MFFCFIQLFICKKQKMDYFIYVTSHPFYFKFPTRMNFFPIRFLRGVSHFVSSIPPTGASLDSNRLSRI